MLTAPPTAQTHNHPLSLVGPDVVPPPTRLPQSPPSCMQTRDAVSPLNPATTVYHPLPYKHERAALCPHTQTWVDLPTSSTLASCMQTHHIIATQGHSAAT